MITARLTNETGGMKGGFARSGSDVALGVALGLELCLGGSKTRERHAVG